MTFSAPTCRSVSSSCRLWLLPLAVGLLGLAGCGSKTETQEPGPSPEQLEAALKGPNPDPRVGLAPGLFDAEEAVWNLKVVSTTPPVQGSGDSKSPSVATAACSR